MESVALEDVPTDMLPTLAPLMCIAAAGTLQRLRAQYQRQHWLASTYSQHLLFERLYTGIDADVDALVEVSLQHVPRAKRADALDNLTYEGHTEDDVLALLESAEAAAQTSAMRDVAASVAGHRSRAQYLLSQCGGEPKAGNGASEPAGPHAEAR